jgi:valine--pyruvate aminotransferase
LNPGPDVRALCVSRPTNPSGNLLSDAEMGRLAKLAADRGIPLIIDNAYGWPFPGIVFGEATPPWNDQTIHVMSLSKLGLPGTRTAFVVGPTQRGGCSFFHDGSHRAGQWEFWTDYCTASH